jgi:hypothetical protein
MKRIEMKLKGKSENILRQMKMKTQHAKACGMQPKQCIQGNL